MTWQSFRLCHGVTVEVCVSGMYSLNVHTDSGLDPFKSIYAFVLFDAKVFALQGNPTWGSHRDCKTTLSLFIYTA